jgi:hypothetical protein
MLATYLAAVVCGRVHGAGEHACGGNMLSADVNHNTLPHVLVAWAGRSVSLATESTHSITRCNVGLHMHTLEPLPCKHPQPHRLEVRVQSACHRAEDGIMQTRPHVIDIVWCASQPKANAWLCALRCVLCLPTRAKCKLLAYMHADACLLLLTYRLRLHALAREGSSAAAAAGRRARAQRVRT